MVFLICPEKDFVGCPLSLSGIPVEGDRLVKQIYTDESEYQVAKRSHWSPESSLMPISNGARYQRRCVISPTNTRQNPSLPIFDFMRPNCIADQESFFTKTTILANALSRP